MILIITHKEDYTADFIINKLNKLEKAYLRLNCEDLLYKSFRYQSDSGFVYKGFNKFKSVWFRRTKLADFSNYNFYEQEFLLGEYDSFLKNIFSIIKTEKWVSDPNNIYRAENKLLQLEFAKKIGFNVPRTLVSTAKTDLTELYNSCNGKVIIKPFYSSKIYDNNKTKILYSNLLRDTDILNIENIEISPALFQEYIEKEKEYRVTVVGKKTFIASVDSQSNEGSKIDWRRENLRFSNDTLPQSIEVMCIDIVQKLGLNFGAIDIIKDTQNNYFFLEVNPNGQWVWIENDTGLGISDSIIELLS